MNLIVMAIVSFIYYRGRAAKDRDYAIARITKEGGKVLKYGRVGFYFKAPFVGIRPYPLHFWYQVEYPYRRGTWYIVTSMNTSPAGEWFWKDAEGKSGLPGFMSQGTESPKVLALGAVTGTVLGYLFLGLLVYFLFRVFSQY